MALNEYFDTALKHLIERARTLNTLVPTDLPRDVHTLVESCRRRLNEIIKKLEVLQNDPRMHLPDNEIERMRRYKQSAKDLAILEKLGFVILNRWDKNDDFLNRLMDGIARQIDYPLTTPVVSSLSQEFYCTYTGLNLLLVPLCESKSLLYLPALCHELAHCLLNCKHNPNIEPFQISYLEAVDKAMKYIQDELIKSERRGEPRLLQHYIKTWYASWYKWNVELFCDLFATFVLGPAFGWTCLHFNIQFGNDPYLTNNLIQSSHPPLAARMDIILMGLSKIGFSEAAGKINDVWNKFLVMSGAKSEPNHNRCFPRELLSYVTEKAFEGMRSIKCRIVSPETNGKYIDLFNSAWEHFWDDSQDFVTWEKEVLMDLRKEILA